MEKMWAFVCGPNKEEPPQATVVEIEDFGKIERARIELRDFLILVGKNNTGKSYLAYLIWAIRAGRLGLSARRKMSVSAPRWFRNDFEQFRSSDRRAMEIDGRKVCESYNRWLAQKKNDLVSSVLNLENFEIGKIKFEFSEKIWLHKPQKAPDWIEEIRSSDWDIDTWGFAWSANWAGVEETGASLRPPLGEELVDAVYRMVVEKLIAGRVNAMWHSAAYLPAARTGLVLAINELAASALKGFQGGGDDPARGGARFTAPMSEFLSALVSTTRPNRGGRFGSVADFLEEHILGGRIFIEGKGVPEFQYSSTGSNRKYPMHVVSSMITELTPILALLRNAHMGSGLVLEEPEAHLHLEAQRYMARALARLVNADLPVAVTTHSDTFLQQINILIRANGLDHRDRLKDLNYDDSDLIDPKKMMIYEFCEHDGRTRVKEAPLGRNGFVVKSVNDTLFRIANEALDFRSPDVE